MAVKAGKAGKEGYSARRLAEKLESEEHKHKYFLTKEKLKASKKKHSEKKEKYYKLLEEIEHLKAELAQKDETIQSLEDTLNEKQDPTD